MYLGNINLPNIEITGFLSSSWIYVVILFAFLIFLIVFSIFYFYYKTYNKKIIIFENISGRGYQPVMKTRARTIKLGIGGEEILKTNNGIYLNAYGKKMGTNTYWFAKGSDGYYYNIILEDLDTKKGILDITPTEKDARMFYSAINRMTLQDYGEKKSFVEKYAVHIFLFIFLIIMLIGIWIITGKISEGIKALNKGIESNVKAMDRVSSVMEKFTENVTIITGIIPKSLS